ncbi:DUF1853 family protein [Marinimicrobium sp. C2-29]|uniref:DUF1853 family protein n=1 Tax=Marinimicrobium sp. C2-29 TaxID=3139825 RepID=UPI00313880D0
MPTNAAFTDLTRYRVAAVRHLAWMCHAPSLVRDPSVFPLADYLPTHARAMLHHWDQYPLEGPPVLTDPPHPRLGLYFEQLYRCLITDLLGWELLANNLQIAGAERTLGELDLVVRNPHTGTAEHHELAVKFYLGYGPAQTPRWYGPNARDRLDLKTRRLLEHQSQMTRRPETAAALHALGIDAPLKARLFMPGYLFYPHDADFPAPAQAPDDHQRGTWCYLETARALDTGHWVHLRKPHWLGPWVQPEAPDATEAENALDSVEATGTPRLLARLEQDPSNGQWIEAERIFVVPPHWPDSSR